MFSKHATLNCLDLLHPDPQSDVLKTLNDFWQTYEISGVSLVDMGIWHWMYDHPDATPAELKAAMLQIAKDIWNKYYAPVFKKKDVVLLAIYSHIIHSFLYIPDYAIGTFDFSSDRRACKGKRNVGAEIERMVKSGSIAPDLWMKNATGSPVNAEAMLKATERALKEYQK